MSGRNVLLRTLALAIFAVAGTAWAQDPVKVGPEIYSLSFENERVRVCEIKFAPGAKIAAHSHPDHFVYVLEPGTMKITKPDGTSSELVATAGQVVWIPAETHWGENIGKTTFRAVVVELKESAKPAATPAPEAKK